MRSIDEGRQDRPTLAGEAEALADRRQTRPETAPERRQRLDRERGPGSEAVNVTRSTAYAPARPTVAMRMPPSAGPTIEAGLEVELVQRDRGRQALGARRGAGSTTTGPAGRPQPSPAGQERDAKSAGDRRRRGAQAATSARLQAASPAWVTHQQPAAVDDVGERARAEREEQDRDELDERQRADRQRRPGQHEDLVRQRDPGDLVADPVDDLAGPQPAVVAIEAERRGVEKQPPDAAVRDPAARPLNDRASGREVRHYLSRSGPASTAWAAASRATGTRNGEQDT